MFLDLLVHADDGAVDDAGWQNGGGIFKGGDTIEIQFGRFVFGE